MIPITQIRQLSIQAVLLLAVCSSSVPAQSTPGYLLRAVYTGIGGTAVTDLTSHAKYPGKPDIPGWVGQFESTYHIRDNYGIRLSGYVHPPVSGNYVFYLSSDDQGVLYLSTDDQPANKRHLVQRQPAGGNHSSKLSHPLRRCSVDRRSRLFRHLDNGFE